ncbi:MAG: hypothetical protein BWY74_01784 [Firmicutes bacterium ADurb.Bin419]|nr:MAG: hypothetical protein BWY74_01784 [Firmicutes bacterium ADurb.Bin419]
MKKLGFGLAVFLFATGSFASVANAADNIVESPDVKIVIEGQKGTYNDVTIIANDRTMLPLREVLTNLGVQNDDQHIIWDASKKSITVKKDDKTIYLEVGKKTVNVNGTETAIDVAPIIYPKNNRTYIPARVVAESLGKQVVWDGATKSVLIADQSSFNEVKEIITKAKQALNDVDKYKVGMEMKMKVSQEDFSMDYDIDMVSEVDKANKIMHSNVAMNMFGANIETEVYMKDGYSYTKSPIAEGWQIEEMDAEEFDEMFSTSSDVSSMEPTDVVCAGMVIAESENPDEIVLRGNVMLADFIDGFNEGLLSSGNEDIAELDMNNFFIEVVYDKNTYMAKSTVLQMTANVEDESGKGQIEIEVGVDVTDVNGDFVIELPQDAVVSGTETAR